MPSGSVPPEPTASRVDGTPNSMIPPTPARTASAAALRSDSRECCTTPGSDAIGRGSVSPSWTNIGSTSCDGATRVSSTRRRIGAEMRSRRGRIVGYVIGTPSSS